MVRPALTMPITVTTAPASMPADELQQLRRELDEIGERRNRQDADRQKLADDTRAIVKRAQGKIQVSEIAERVGLERTVIYRTYK